MINEFIKKWDKHKSYLEEYFKNTNQSEYNNYTSIVKILFEKVIDRNKKFDIDNILVIDDGEYQGTQIFIIHKDTYQPSISDYVYTNTYYGSCSGCDTLQAISGYDEGLPSKEQVKDYMQLALNILQRLKYMSED